MLMKVNSTAQRIISAGFVRFLPLIVSLIATPLICVLPYTTATAQCANNRVASQTTGTAVMGAAFQLIGRATNLKPPSLIGLFLCSCKRAASAAAFAAATASASAVVGVGSRGLNSTAHKAQCMQRTCDHMSGTSSGSTSLHVQSQ
eukprot:6834-Heterococcus_DN1.PRE.2